MHLHRILPLLCTFSLSLYLPLSFLFFFFFFNDTATTEIYTLSLHDALPIYACARVTSARSCSSRFVAPFWTPDGRSRSEEHTSELQSPVHLVCRLLLEKKKKNKTRPQQPKNK